MSDGNATPAPDAKADAKAAAKALEQAIAPPTELDDGAGNTVSVDQPMVAEPGHRRAEAAVAAGVFDPNVAARLASGRGPGMQDSEARDPATWVQPGDVVAADLVAAHRDGSAPQGAPDNRPEQG